MIANERFGRSRLVQASSHFYRSRGTLSRYHRLNARPWSWFTGLALGRSVDVTDFSSVFS